MPTGWEDMSAGELLDICSVKLDEAIGHLQEFQERLHIARLELRAFRASWMASKVREMREVVLGREK